MAPYGAISWRHIALMAPFSEKMAPHGAIWRLSFVDYFAVQCNDFLLLDWILSNLT